MQTSKNGGKGHEAHVNCRSRCEEFIRRMDTQTDIYSEMHESLRQRMDSNKEVLKSIVKTVVLCGRQNLALRGDRDDSKYYDSNKNTGNFQALLDFRVESGDIVLKEHFDNAPRNATYRSKTIQNEIIAIIGHKIQEHIVGEIQEAGGWFSLSADEVQDVSNHEQLAICLRYANVKGDIQDRLVALQDVSGDTTGENLSAEILSVVQRLGLDPNKLRSQCYDGAGNMMGKVKGVGPRIQQLFPKALPFWCTSHLLNLCIVAACDISEVKNMMGVADKCVRFFNDSTKRQTFLETEISNIDGEKRAKLKALCRTRWVQRHDAFEVFVDLYPSIVEALNQILDVEKRPDAITDTSGILHAVTSFQFVMTLMVVRQCMGYLKALSICLQAKALYVVTALKDVNIVRDVITEKRTNVDSFHAEVYAEAVDLAAMVGIAPSIPRRCGRQNMRNNMPADGPDSYYKRIVTVPFLDHLIQQFSQRFTLLQERAATALLLVLPVSPDLDAANLDYFIEDIPSPATLHADLECWRMKWRHAGPATTPTSLSEALAACSKSMYPNVHVILRIAATFPVTSCQCERSISTLGIVKTALRSTMKQDRLIGLCLMSVHRDINVNADSIVTEFARTNSRKMKLPDILNCDV